MIDLLIMMYKYLIGIFSLELEITNQITTVYSKPKKDGHEYRHVVQNSLDK
jgi:hypothetical protein